MKRITHENGQDTAWVSASSRRRSEETEDSLPQTFVRKMAYDDDSDDDDDEIQAICSRHE